MTPSRATWVRRILLPLAICGFTAVQPARVAAQSRDTLDVAASLDDRLDSPTRHAVQAVIDSAVVTGVPARPLIAKALEGAVKHAPGARIVSAVRSLALDLGVARQALGPDTDESTLIAGTDVLRAGVSASYLESLQEARPAALAWPFAVLADLVGRGVPADTAGSVMLALVRSGATDAALTAFEQQVLRDVGAGVPPGAAAVARAPAGTGQGMGPGAGRPFVPPVGSPPSGAAPRASHPHPAAPRPSIGGHR